MKQGILALCAVCMASAFCAQLLQGNGYMNVIRLAIGMEILRVIVNASGEWMRILGG